MNERIKELWDQAAKLETDPSWEGQTKFMEKFSELLIRECSKVYWNIDDGELHSEYVNALKEHFGVE